MTMVKKKLLHSTEYKSLECRITMGFLDLVAYMLIQKHPPPLQMV